MDHRNAGQSTGDSPHDVGPDSAVQMNDIWRDPLDHPIQSMNQSNIEITCHGQADHLPKRRGSNRERTAHPADEYVLNATRLKPFHQQQDLMGSAVEISPPLNV
jgi:hypothetical protein